MKTRVFSVGLVMLSISSLASAQDDGAPPSEVRTAPAQAWELQLANGYNQGFGDAGGDSFGLGDHASFGTSLQLGFGYRLDPRLFLGVYVEGAKYFESGSAEKDTGIYSVASGVQANWHFAPFEQLDPWVGAGAGVRGYWVDHPNAGSTALYGLDVLRARVGFDYHFSDWMVIGPTLGASVTTFLGQDSGEPSGVDSVAELELSTFVFAGLQSRFDFGERISESQRRIARR